MSLRIAHGREFAGARRLGPPDPDPSSVGSSGAEFQLNTRGHGLHVATPPPPLQTWCRVSECVDREGGCSLLGKDGLRNVIWRDRLSSPPASLHGHRSHDRNGDTRSITERRPFPCLSVCMTSPASTWILDDQLELSTTTQVLSYESSTRRPAVFPITSFDPPPHVPQYLSM